MDRRGAFIVVVGPDGVGKTTLARSLLERAGGGWYFHFIPTPTGSLASSVTGVGQIVEKNTGSGGRLAGVLRISRNLARAWFAYLRTIRPAVRSGSIVVGDRWLYGYVTQPRSLKFHGPEWLARLVLRLMPQPDLVVSLHASPEVILRRKPELSAEEIEAESRLLRETLSCALEIDATGDPDLIAADVLDHIVRDVTYRLYPPVLRQVALPVTRDVALAASSLYTPVRPRALLAHRLGRSLIRTFGTGWLGRSRSDVLPCDPATYDAILSILSSLGLRTETLAFHRRTQVGRPGFLALALADGRPVGVVRAGSPETVGVECAALRTVQLYDPRSFRAPRLLGREHFGELDLAVHSAVIEGYHHPPRDPPLDEVVREIKEALASLSRPSGTPEHWEPMHGDLTPWNLRQSRVGLSLIDWERAGWGPPKADETLYRGTTSAFRGRFALPLLDREAAQFWLSRVTTEENLRDARLANRLRAVYVQALDADR